MDLDSKLNTIKLKVSALRLKDTLLQSFGASAHQYEFNPTCSEHGLCTFENRFAIQLPIEYRRFLKEIGNGGVSPSYGLEPLENALFQDLDYCDENYLIDPSKEFMMTNAWNMEVGDCEDEEYDIKENEYFDPKWANGLLRIANLGCGISVNIVVKGLEYGNMWIDDRVNRNGIYPYKNAERDSRVGFLEWYDYWLADACSEPEY